MVNRAHDNFKECINFVDCATSSLGNHSVFELNWCYEEFLSLLLCDTNTTTTTTTMCDPDDHIMQSFKNMSLHQVMKGMFHKFKFINQPPKHDIIISKSCLCCRATVKDAVYMCGEVMMSPTYHVFASVIFGKRFDFNSCDECISMENLTMTDTDSQLFFYSVAKERDAVEQQCRGKDMNALRTGALCKLTSTMDSFKEKWDSHRPSSETVCTNKIQMYLSQIDKPLRRSNNDKGELKLHNHARALTQLGDSWISNYVSEQLFMIDLLEPMNKGSSYIAKSKDYQAFPREVYKIVTRSTLYKLENYFKANQRFTVNKEKAPIRLSLLPTDNPPPIQLPNRSTIKANVRELMHQLSSIQYRCRDNSNFSQCL